MRTWYQCGIEASRNVYKETGEKLGPRKWYAPSGASTRPFPSSCLPFFFLLAPVQLLLLPASLPTPLSLLSSLRGAISRSFSVFFHSLSHVVYILYSFPFRIFSPSAYRNPFSFFTHNLENHFFFFNVSNGNLIIEMKQIVYKMIDAEFQFSSCICARWWLKQENYNIIYIRIGKKIIVLRKKFDEIIIFPREFDKLVREIQEEYNFQVWRR